MTNSEKPLFHLLGTPVIVEPAAGFTAAVSAVLTALLAGERGLSNRLAMGAFGALCYPITDIIHYAGHIVSSRQVQAPMDAVRISAPMPSSVYLNNDVPPAAHMGRAIGGPIASTTAMLAALALRPLTAAGSVARRLVTVFALFQAIFGLGALAPMPIIDGGTLLKWSLVARGRTEAEADSIVQQAFSAFLAVAGVIGGLWAIRKISAK
ncbi:MAG: hypothetical protein D6768_14480 [Chloroflexi bacterium]|nr:MAG: hypothetical protein D6768_14480 [Chloroflexota bacterium]